MSRPKLILKISLVTFVVFAVTIVNWLVSFACFRIWAICCYCYNGVVISIWTLISRTSDYVKFELITSGFVASVIGCSSGVASVFPPWIVFTHDASLSGVAESLGSVLYNIVFTLTSLLFIRDTDSYLSAFWSFTFLMFSFVAKVTVSSSKLDSSAILNCLIFWPTGYLDLAFFTTTEPPLSPPCFSNVWGKEWETLEPVCSPNTTMIADFFDFKTDAFWKTSEVVECLVDFLVGMLGWGTECDVLCPTASGIATLY